MQSEFIPAHIPEAFSESGFLNRPVEVRKMQEREPGRTAIDRRDLKVAMDSAAVEALRLATITFERVTDLVDVVDGDLTKPH